MSDSESLRDRLRKIIQDEMIRLYGWDAVNHPEVRAALERVASLAVQDDRKTRTYIPTNATKLSVTIENYIHAPHHSFDEGMGLLRAAVNELRQMFVLPGCWSAKTRIEGDD